MPKKHVIFMAKEIREERHVDLPIVEVHNTRTGEIRKGYSLDIVDETGRVVARIVHDYGGVKLDSLEPNRFVRAWIETDLDVVEGPKIDTYKRT